MNNYERYFGTPERLDDALDEICDRKAAACDDCPFLGERGCVINIEWLESEADDA